VANELVNCHKDTIRQLTDTKQNTKNESLSIKTMAIRIVKALPL